MEDHVIEEFFTCYQDKVNNKIKNQKFSLF